MTNTLVIECINTVDYILSVGSVDGICTSAAIIRNSEYSPDIIFCQAFTIDKINISQWRINSKILFVDLAVNNRDTEMTVKFLRCLKSAGHAVVGVLDEHSAEDWKYAFDAAGLSFDDLTIKPVSQNTGDIKSSGALLASLLGDDVDKQTVELCHAADAGDRMDFTTYFGNIVNKAIKSKIDDDSRRVHLAKHLADHDAGDRKINTWIAEYETILANHAEIIEKRKDLGEGIVRINSFDKVVDMTTLMKTVYDLGYEVVLTEREIYDKLAGSKIRQIAIGCKPGLNIDALSIVKSYGIECSGFESKVNVNLIDEDAALNAIRSVMEYQ